MNTATIQTARAALETLSDANLASVAAYADKMAFWHQGKAESMAQHAVLAKQEQDARKGKIR